MNLNMLMQMVKTGGNPQAILNNMLQNNYKGNPIADNIMQMMKNHDSKGIETIARNLCQSKGIDPDEMLKQIQNQLR